MKKYVLSFLLLFPWSFLALAATKIPSRTIEIIPQVTLSTIQTTSTPISENLPIVDVLPYTLERIAACESTGSVQNVPRQFLSSGEVVRGFPNPNDIGEFQINLPTWESQAKELGYDVFTQEGNIKMAEWIYAKLGTSPWRYSENCWK